MYPYVSCVHVSVNCNSKNWMYITSFDQWNICSYAFSSLAIETQNIVFCSQVYYRVSVAIETGAILEEELKLHNWNGKTLDINWNGHQAKGLGHIEENINRKYFHKL